MDDSMFALLRKSLRWSVGIGMITALIAMVLSLSSTTLMKDFSWQGGMIVLLIIIGIGIIFDMLGIAAAAAKEQPFHAMAAKKIPGSKEAIGIVRRADQFSNFCNDVVGDISGVISGAAALVVIASIMRSAPSWQEITWLEDGLNVFLVSLISAVTVGGKALGKSLSIHFANQIIFQVGRIFFFINKKFHLSIFHVNKKRKRKRGGFRGPRAN